MGVAFNVATRCIQGTLDTLNRKTVLKMTSHGTHGPFYAAEGRLALPQSVGKQLQDMKDSSY